MDFIKKEQSYSYKVTISSQIDFQAEAVRPPKFCQPPPCCFVSVKSDEYSVYFTRRVAWLRGIKKYSIQTTYIKMQNKYVY